MGKARRGGKSKRPKRGTDGLRFLLLVVAAFLVIRTFIVQAYRIPSASMEDTLVVGDFVLANKLAYGPHLPFTDLKLPGFGSPTPGEIIIFRFPLDPSREFVKRCMAGPGQTVEVRNKVLYVDGERTVDPRYSKYVDPRILPKESRSGTRDNFGPVTVPPGHFFVIGDNRDNSDDSRFWGFVPEANVVARPFVIYFSWSPDPEAPVYGGLTSLPGMFAYNLTHFVDRIRWDRLAAVPD